MNSRRYNAPLFFIFLGAALLAGCNGSQAALDTPTRSAPQQDPDVSGVRIWAIPKANPPNTPSVIYGFNLGAKRLVTVIHTAKQSTPGYYPIALRVDHDQNLWVLNQSETKDLSGPPVVQEYTAGSFTAAYVASCNSVGVGCPVLTDLAVNATYVLAFGLLSSSYPPVGGFEAWQVGQPSAKPRWSTQSDPYYYCQYRPAQYVCQIYHGDIDDSNNIWLVASACAPGSTNCSGIGLFERPSPWNNRTTFSQIEPPGTYPSPGYIDVNATTVNVELTPLGSQYSDEIIQYALPVSASGAPSNVLTPCLYPCSGGGFGFNATQKQVVIGDGSSEANGWLDIGITSKNKWKTVPFLSLGRFGAAVYTPSDK